MKQSQQKPNIVVLKPFFLTTKRHLACYNISSFTFFPARRLSDFSSTVHTQNRFKSAHHVTEKPSYAVVVCREDSGTARCSRRLSGSLPHLYPGQGVIRLHDISSEL